MKISVMITTLNRVEDLKKTLEFLRSLNPLPCEVLVTADGCVDGTVEITQQQFSEVRLIINERSMGSVASRHRMMLEAKGDLVLALDDDSHPEQLDCISRLAEIFEQNPQLAIMTFPQRTDEYPETLERTDFGQAMPVRSFANSGACLRVATYRSLPGFEPMFFHMYEEPDYALQCVAAGLEVRFIPQITIRHHWVGRERSEIRNHHRHADTAADVHSPVTRSFLVSHMGWFLTPRGFPTDEKVIPDLMRYPELRWLDRFDLLVPVALAVGLFALGWVLETQAPGLGTDRWQLLVWGFFVSTVVLFHVAVSINSLAHRWGTRRYATADNSRNNAVLALLTLGEGWHNNHHHYPGSARQGFHWWEIDITYYGLRAMALVGLVRDLRPVPEKMLHARLEAAR